MVKGIRTVAIEPNAVLLEYHALKRLLTLKVIVDPAAVHPAATPQLNRIGVALSKRKLRVDTTRVGAYRVIAATNPSPVFSVEVVVIVGGVAGNVALPEIENAAFL